MAQEKYSVSLKKARFPLLSELQSLTVMAANARAKENSADEPPQIAYCENVLPTIEGMESVHLLDIIPGVVAHDTDLNPFIDVRIMYGDEMNRYYLGVTALSQYWVLDQSVPESPVWVLSAFFWTAPYDSEKLTIATVNGISYHYYQGSGIVVTYDESTGLFATVTLIGIDMGQLLGLAASNGYLVAYTTTDTAWSSTIDPLDFTPSDVTGAGGGTVEDIAGEILFVTSNPLGLVYYSEANAVAATYTGNVQYPFKYREIDNSKGGISLDLIAYEANSDPQFVYTKAGMQSLTSNAADTILPELTDFLSGRRIERYDPSTFTLSQYNLIPAEKMKKKVKYINSRYLCISYGACSCPEPVKHFTDCIIYDTALNRMGKIVIPHADVFEYIGDQLDIAKQSITFLQEDGNCFFVKFDPTVPSDIENPGVIILARLQATHTRLLTLHEVKLTSISKFVQNEYFQCVDLPTLDGHDDSDSSEKVVGYESYIGGGTREFLFCNTALNHRLILQGKFRLTEALITYVQDGRR